MTALVVLAAASPAFADELPTIDSAIPPAIRIGARDGRAIPRVALDLHSAPDVSWLAIDLPQRRDTELDLSVPAGTRVVGVVLVFDSGERRWSSAQPARQAYSAFVDGPATALARHAGSSGDLDHLLLHAAIGGRIELALELPALPRLALDPATGTRFDRADITIDGKPARSRTAVRDAVVLDTRALVAIQRTAPYAHVDATTSLVVGNPTRDPGRVVETRMPSVPYESFGKRGIRTVVHHHQAQLRQCYMQVAQWQPSVAGTVKLSFFIEDDGTVTWSDATGELPEAVTTCVRDLALTWTFAPQQRVLVNYPLIFRLSE